MTVCNDCHHFRIEIGLDRKAFFVRTWDPSGGYCVGSSFRSQKMRHNLGTRPREPIVSSRGLVPIFRPKYGAFLGLIFSLRIAARRPRQKKVHLYNRRMCLPSFIGTTPQGSVPCILDEPASIVQRVMSQARSLHGEVVV